MKFFGQFTPPVDKILYERYFKHFSNPGFFIECGAADGVSESCCYFFERNLQWKGLNIEASPAIYNVLTKNRPKSQNVHRALSNRSNEKVLFKATIHPIHGELFGNGSLSHTPEHLADLQSQNVLFKDVEVNTITYDDVISLYNIKKIDLFVLDIEGHELPVLNSLSSKSILPTIFVIEHGHIGQAALQKILDPLGYELDYSEENNSYFIRNESLSPEIIRAIFEFEKGKELSKRLDIVEKESITKFNLISSKIDEKTDAIINILANEIKNSKSIIMDFINQNRPLGRSLYKRFFKSKT